jgi:sugar phosphate isomerase/epimerase
MKIGVSSYSFSRLVGSGKMNQLDVVKKARRMGFDVIEFAGLTLPQGETAESFAKKLREECARENIEMGNYSIGADFLYGSSGDLEAEIERLKGELKISQMLGAPGMRHDVAYGFKPGTPAPKGFADALPRLVRGCRAVTEYAAELGIKTMVENHGFFCQDSERVEALVNGVGHENFGVLVDIGNFLCADEDPTKAVGRLVPYMFHAHVKDFHVKHGTAPDPGRGWFRSRGGNYLRGAIIGHGDVPVGQCLHVIRDSGYDGTVSIEFEGMENPVEAIEIGLENLRAYLGQCH